MSDRTTNYPPETEEETHDNLNLRDMVTWDPRVGSDLVIDAYKDLSYQSKLNGFKDIVEDPELRAEKFAKELTYGTTHRHVDAETAIIDPTNFSKKHGENWREQLQATSNFSNIIMNVAEDRIHDGLLDHSEKKVEEGRLLLEASTNAAIKFRDDIEFSQRMTQVQGELRWAAPESEGETSDGFRDDENTREYVQTLTGLIPEELRSKETFDQLTDAMKDIIDHWQERDGQKIREAATGLGISVKSLTRHLERIEITERRIFGDE